MEKREFYSSRKKAMWMMLIAIPFLVFGISCIMNGEGIEVRRTGSPYAIYLIGGIVALFAGIAFIAGLMGIFVKRLELLVDEKGITFNPKKESNPRIEWKYIDKIDEVVMNESKIIRLLVNNPKEWVEQEPKMIKRNRMANSFKEYGSPFLFVPDGYENSQEEVLNYLKSFHQKFGTGNI